MLRKIDNQYACYGYYSAKPKYSHISIGDNSCNRASSCRDMVSTENEPTRVGNNSCNLENTARGCEAGSVVPDGSCNSEDGADVTYGNIRVESEFGWYDEMRDQCNYCFVSLVSVYLLPTYWSSLTLLALCCDLQTQLYKVKISAKITACDSQCMEKARELESLSISAAMSHDAVRRVMTENALFGKANNCGECRLAVVMTVKSNLLNRDMPSIADFVHEKLNEYVGDEFLLQKVVDENLSSIPSIQWEG